MSEQHPSPRPLKMSRPAADWIVSAIPPETLLAFLRTMRVTELFFSGGFKVNVQNVGRSAVRRKISLQAHREPVFAAALVDLEGGAWALWEDVLPMFSESWLVSSWRVLLRSQAEPALAVAMARDPRPRIARRGQRLLCVEALWETETDSVAVDAPDAWRPLAELMAPLSGTSDPADTEEIEGNRRRIAALERENQQLRDSLARQKERVRHAKNAREQELAEARGKLRELRHRVKELEQEASAAGESFNARIQEREAELRRRMLGVDPEIVRLADELASGDLEGLLKAARRARKQQAALNERHGTLEEVRGTIESLQAARSSLATSARESIRVHPDTRSVLTALSQRIEELQQRLRDATGSEPDPGALSTYFELRLKEAPLTPAGLADVSDVRALLKQPGVAELLGESALARLLGIATEREKWISGLAKRPQSERVARAGAAEVWDVGKRLTEDPVRPVVLVDGYNVIRRVESLAAHEQTSGLAAARERLERLAAAKADGFERLEIVYDGVGPLAERDVRDGVVIVFSSQQAEDQNADRYLVDQARRLRPRAARIWLVTDDFGLRELAEPACDAFVTPVHFHGFLTG